MTSTAQTTESAGRATVPQILAHLIILGQRESLPDPIGMDATASNGIVRIELSSREQITSWRDGLGSPRDGRGRPNEIDSQQFSTDHPHRAGHWLHTCYVKPVEGWSVHLTALTSGAGTTDPIEAEALRELAAVTR